MKKTVLSTILLMSVSSVFGGSLEQQVKDQQLRARENKVCQEVGGGHAIAAYKARKRKLSLEAAIKASDGYDMTKRIYEAVYSDSSLTRQEAGQIGWAICKDYVHEEATRKMQTLMGLPQGN